MEIMSPFTLVMRALISPLLQTSKVQKHIGVLLTQYASLSPTCNINLMVKSTVCGGYCHRFKLQFETRGGAQPFLGVFAQAKPYSKLCFESEAR